MSGKARGDFAGVVEQVLEARLGQSSTLTIGELNRTLDTLARAVTTEEREKVLATLLRPGAASGVSLFVGALVFHSTRQHTHTVWGVAAV